jgi:hypothetical protein
MFWALAHAIACMPWAAGLAGGAGGGARRRPHSCDHSLLQPGAHGPRGYIQTAPHTPTTRPPHHTPAQPTHHPPPTTHPLNAHQPAPPPPPPLCWPRFPAIHSLLARLNHAREASPLSQHTTAAVPHHTTPPPQPASQHPSPPPPHLWPAPRPWCSQLRGLPGPPHIVMSVLKGAPEAGGAGPGVGKAAKGGQHPGQQPGQGPAGA